jgi:hypothetical protein
VIDKSDLQFAKHDEPRISTLHGITIDSIDEYENAEDSIRVSCEFDSNVIDESEKQLQKHFDPRSSTVAGITID